jgi:hypothetical protein
MAAVMVVVMATAIATAAAVIAAVAVIAAAVAILVVCRLGGGLGVVGGDLEAGGTARRALGIARSEAMTDCDGVAG